MTKSDPRLDLCGKHSREVYNFFQPRKRSGGRPKGFKEDPEVNKERHKKLAKLWGERKKRVLAMLDKTGKAYHELKGAKMNKHILMHTLRKLKEEGKVKREGWSLGARWSLVEEADGS